MYIQKKIKKKVDQLPRLIPDRGEKSAMKSRRKKLCWTKMKEKAANGGKNKKKSSVKLPDGTRATMKKDLRNFKEGREVG